MPPLGQHCAHLPLICAVACVAALLNYSCVPKRYESPEGGRCLLVAGGVTCSMRSRMQQLVADAIAGRVSESQAREKMQQVGAAFLDPCRVAPEQGSLPSP